MRELCAARSGARRLSARLPLRLAALQCSDLARAFWPPDIGKRSIPIRELGFRLGSAKLASHSRRAANRNLLLVVFDCTHELLALLLLLPLLCLRTLVLTAAPREAPALRAR